MIFLLLSRVMQTGPGMILKKFHLSAELEHFTDISYKIDLLSGEFQGDLGFLCLSV